MFENNRHRARTRDFTAIAVGTLLACGLCIDAEAQLTVRAFASGLSVPLAFVQDPTDRAVQFVVEQSGRIRVVRNGTVLPTDFINLGSAIAFGGEQGLLGLAFAPDYAASGRFFVNFTNTDGNTVVARFRRSGDPLVADPASRFDLRWGGPSGLPFIAQPFANHNGGNLVFGPDGYLYIGLGDGGSADDPGNRAQDPSQFLGKMLRIDVNVPDGDPTGYRVPPDNPFVAGVPVVARPEIWDFGLRNPWRYSFDDPARGGTGALIIGDVGQSHWEEIDYEPPVQGGRNYGWRYREGAHDNVTSIPPAYLPLVDPIHEYDHSGAPSESVTGGYVYRGQALGSAFQGRYFFADLYGRVWSMQITPDQSLSGAHVTDLVEHTAALGGVSRYGYISSFGVDADGELYIASYTLGTIFKLAGLLPVQSDFNGDGKADLAQFDPPAGRWLISGQSTVQWGTSGDVPVPADYDGNRTIDVAVWRPANGYWFVNGGITAKWGEPGDIPVPADYTGGGRAQPAVFRPSNGYWFVLGGPSVQWGQPGDIPVPADYDGDGRVDIAVFRPSTGYWYIRGGVSRRFGQAGDIPVPADYDGDGRADLAVYRPTAVDGGPSWYVNGIGAWTIGSVGDLPVPQDLDGDGQAELVVYRPSSGAYYSYFRATNTWQTDVRAAGTMPLLLSPALRKAVPGDVDRDRRRDPAIYRPSDATWWTLPAAGGLPGVRWGAGGDIPVGGDYDGDGLMDFAVYRPATGTWWILFSNSGYTTAQAIAWGASTDIPLVGDIDGDGKADPIVFRPSNGTWWALLSSTVYATSRSWNWGLGSDVPVSGDFDGDGHTDITVFRPSSGTWWTLLSSSGYATSLSWSFGASGDRPVAGDYDGDGVTDVAVYRPSDGTWRILFSASGFTASRTLQWGGGAGYTIVPGDYDGDGKADLAVWSSSGAWYVRQSSTDFATYTIYQWGASGDIPVPAFDPYSSLISGPS